jgi:translation initiation factor IF-1
MPKEDIIIVNGKVTEVLGSGRYRVELENGHKLICTLKGKMKKHMIRVLPDDTVEVEPCPYDLTRGFIHFRKK